MEDGKRCREEEVVVGVAGIAKGNPSLSSYLPTTTITLALPPAPLHQNIRRGDFKINRKQTKVKFLSVNFRQMALFALMFFSTIVYFARFLSFACFLQDN